MCISSYCHFILLVLLFVMGKYIERIYKHSQSQLSTLSLKTPVSSSSEPQTSSAIELTTSSVPYVTDKHQNNYVFYSKNTIENDATITKNDNIKSYKTLCCNCLWWLHHYGCYFGNIKQNCFGFCL